MMLNNYTQKEKNINNFKGLKRFIVLGCLVAGLVFSNFGEALAVKIIPPRLVIGPDVKVEYMFIKNNSAKPETFRFGWKHIGMDKEGNIINLDKFGMDKAPGYKAADDLIRYSPRRAVLEPGQTQRITFMMRRSPELAAGEYRSHFLVEREPSVKAQPSPEGEKTAPVAGSSVEVEVLISRSVPIYVLNGETNASLSLISAELKRNPDSKTNKQPENMVHFRVQKTGNRSVIGVADVLCKTSAGEDVKASKVSKVFAVYAEGEFRNEKMAIELPAGSCPSMRITLKAHPNDVLAGQILAEGPVKN